MFCCSFEIAGIAITLKTERPIRISKRFLPFLRGKDIGGYEAVFHETEELPALPGGWIQTESAFDVGRYPSGMYCRRFRDMKREEQVYAVSLYDWDRKRIEVAYLKQGETNLNESDNCFFHLAWETILQLENRMILHACGVDTSLGGILFSGRSGIGKSTQGRLWCDYEKASQINGDRPVLRKEGEIWYACGSPYAGSSGCHRDTRAAVRAIVMLEQAQICSVRRLEPGEAFRSIYAGMTLSPWNPDCMKNSCDLAVSLISDIPVYEMKCTPDRRAVELLKQTLQAEDAAQESHRGADF